MDYPVTWTFVWQGAMTDDEAEEFANGQLDREPLFDGGGLWLEAMPQQCKDRGAHVARFHPDESWQSYCVICGEYPVDNPAWAEAREKMNDPAFKAKVESMMAMFATEPPQ